MAKLALFVFTLSTIITLFEVSAYRTTLITPSTIDDRGDGTLIGSFNNPTGWWNQCPNEIPIEHVNHCQMHLTQGIISNDEPKMVVNRRTINQPQQHFQQCCTQLKKVSKQCQCDAIQQAYDEARQQHGVVEMRQMLSKAQRLPNECRLDVPDCPLVSPKA